MFCIHCGKEIADGSQFCGFCGQSQDPTARSDGPNDGSIPKQTPPAADPTPQPTKKSKLPLIGGIVAGIIVIAVGVIALTSGGSKKNATAGGDVSDQVMNVVQSVDPHVQSVKNGTPLAYPGQTYGPAFENFFAAPTWKYFVGTKDGPDENGDGKPDYTEENVDIVEFTGRCTYQDVEVKALIQFTLNKDDDTFEATYLSFNDVPQSMLMLYGLLDKVFSESDASVTASAPSASTSSISLDASTPVGQTTSQSIPTWCEGTYYSNDSYYGGDAQHKLTFYGGNPSNLSLQFDFDGIGYFNCSGIISRDEVTFASDDGSFRGVLTRSGDDGVNLQITLSDFIVTKSGSVYFYRNSTLDQITDSPLNDFTVYGYSYSEALAQGWGDTFAEIANQMGTDGESAMSRFMWFVECCDSTYFTREDISGFDKDMAMLARNAPYAHEGRMFNNETIQNFFLNWKWYVGYIAPDAFQETMLNDYERANKELVMAYEKEMGYK